MEQRPNVVGGKSEIPEHVRELPAGQPEAVSKRQNREESRSLGPAKSRRRTQGLGGETEEPEGEEVLEEAEPG
eukprot:14235224-Alexandrium_andersonii.AAC.1